MVDLIFDEYPWMKHLPPDARAEFTTDCANALQASADAGDWSILADEVGTWRNTAEIYADPALFRALTKPCRADGGLLRSALTTTVWMIRTQGGRRLRLGKTTQRRASR
ncbi:MAG TPA: DUF6247 family protein [Pseudonocardiaceae bacterium]|nr:DUF6247 family protein [Pseudonocardiaceae bacterium]